MRDLHICSIIVKIYATYVLHISIVVREVSLQVRKVVSVAASQQKTEKQTIIYGQTRRQQSGVTLGFLVGLQKGTRHVEELSQGKSFMKLAKTARNPRHS